MVKCKNGYTFAPGEMAEWSIAAVLKTVELRGSGGSNPSLSATRDFSEVVILSQPFLLRQECIRESICEYPLIVIRMWYTSPPKIYCKLRRIGKGNCRKPIHPNDLQLPLYKSLFDSKVAEGKNERNEANPLLRID